MTECQGTIRCQSNRYRA